MGPVTRGQRVCAQHPGQAGCREPSPGRWPAGYVHRVRPRMIMSWAPGTRASPRAVEPGSPPGRSWMLCAADKIHPGFSQQPGHCHVACRDQRGDAVDADAPGEVAQLGTGQLLFSGQEAHLAGSGTQPGEPAGHQRAGPAGSAPQARRAARRACPSPRAEASNGAGDSRRDAASRGCSAAAIWWRQGAPAGCGGTCLDATSGQARVLSGELPAIPPSPPAAPPVPGSCAG